MTSLTNRTIPVKDLTNGQLYDEYNQLIWASRNGEEVSTDRMLALEVEFLSRPAEQEG